MLENFKSRMSIIKHRALRILQFKYVTWIAFKIHSETLIIFVLKNIFGR